VWQQFMAISALANISSPLLSEPKHCIDALDAFLLRIQGEYTLTSEDVWCLPDDQHALSQTDCNGGICSRWPSYENGLCVLRVSGSGWQIYPRRVRAQAILTARARSTSACSAA
jgi:hypothetical protein